mmetsp:Transcript_125529/g.366675  ORF Transcript_125529/g.366675 Transcript_125529/m.366675 type:complete len:349 (-) Transcript_125529:291-1337(-)
MPKLPLLVTTPLSSVPTSMSSMSMAPGWVQSFAAAFAFALVLALVPAGFAFGSGAALGLALAWPPVEVALALELGSWRPARAGGAGRSGSSISSSSGSSRERSTLTPPSSRPSTVMPLTSSSAWNCLATCRGSCSKASVTAPMSTSTPLRLMLVTVPLTWVPARNRERGEPSVCSILGGFDLPSEAACRGAGAAAACSALAGLGLPSAFGFGAAAGFVLAAAFAPAEAVVFAAGRLGGSSGCSSSPSTDSSGSSIDTLMFFASTSTVSILMPYTSSPLRNWLANLFGTCSRASFSQPMFTKTPYWVLALTMPSHRLPVTSSSMGMMPSSSLFTAFGLALGFAFALPFA